MQKVSLKKVVTSPLFFLFVLVGGVIAVFTLSNPFLALIGWGIEMVVITTIGIITEERHAILKGRKIKECIINNLADYGIVVAFFVYLAVDSVMPGKIQIIWLFVGILLFSFLLMIISVSYKRKRA